MLKYRLLNIQPKHPYLITLITLSFIILIIILYKVHTYDSVATTGIITCNETCEIKLTLPYDKIAILNSHPSLTFNNETYNIDNIVYGEPYLNNNIVYQDITITTNLYSDNPLINFKILNNRQRIITKIKNVILER